MGGQDPVHEGVGPLDAEAAQGEETRTHDRPDARLNRLQARRFCEGDLAEALPEDRRALGDATGGDQLLLAVPEVEPVDDLND